MVVFQEPTSQLLESEPKQQKTDASPPSERPVGDVDVNSVVNPKLVHAEYAVRGRITDRAVEIEKQLASGKHSFSFKKVLHCNIGNPQSLGQAPISYFRRLLALCECPELMEGGGAAALFPSDVIHVAQQLQEQLSIGAYTASLGHPALRQMVATGIQRRDGHAASIESPSEHICLSNGASASVHNLLASMIKDSSDSFLVPVPQYPLYSCALTLYGGTLIPYYLDEASNWGVDVLAVEQLIRSSQAKGCRVRGMVVIHPGNPTGQVLSQDNQRKIVQLCASMGVPIIADEVYQENVWASDKTFTSFRKIVLDDFQHLSPILFSLHSTSKGYLGECGHRGGFLNMLNCPNPLLTQLSKLMSISLCSNTAGQAGSPSYEQFHSQTSGILESLARRAGKLAKGLRALEGVTCCEPEGALYVFPRLTIPEKAQAQAGEKGIEPDFLYCQELLDSTGIVAVPGSGFGQVAGTHHMRLTILAPEADMDTLLHHLSLFHALFMSRYSPAAVDQYNQAT